MRLVYVYSDFMQCVTLHPAFRKEKKEELVHIKLAMQCILLESEYIFKVQVLAFGTTE